MYGKVCAVFGCNNYELKNVSKSFFRFPLNRTLCDVWVNKCRRSDLDDIYKREGPTYLYKTYKICSDHFKSTDFRNSNLFSQGLKRGSAPTENLPSSIPSASRPSTRGSPCKRRRESECEIAFSVPGDSEPTTCLPPDARCPKGHIMECKSEDDKTRIKHEIPQKQNDMQCEIEIKQETRDEISQKQNDVQCVIGIKQETWDEVSQKQNDECEMGVKQVTWDPVPCQGTSIIKTDDEIDIKEETWWCEEKQEDLEKYEVTEDVQSPRSTTEAVYGSSRNNTFSVFVNNIACYSETPSGRNVNKESSKRENICNPTTDIDHFEPQQNICDEQSFSNQQLLNRHSKSKPYACYICSKSFRRKLDLNMHFSVHLGINLDKFDCSEKYVTQRSELDRHVLSHSGTEQFKCEHCEKCFTRKTNLDRHKWFHSGIKPYKCEHCDKCFTFKSDLKRHTLIHSGTKPYKCNHCEKCFSRKLHLEEHVLIHLGTKPYKCEHCKKCFTLKSRLKKHALMHSGMKQHKCELCEQCYAWKSDLDRHKLFHSGIKPFKCEQCGKCFTLKSDLKRHTLLHSRTKPYKCEPCDKGFTRKSRLKGQLLGHSGTKPY